MRQSRQRFKVQWELIVEADTLEEALVSAIARLPVKGTQNTVPYLSVALEEDAENDINWGHIDLNEYWRSFN